MTGLGDYVAVDLETTGLSVRKEKIIEVGAVRVVDGNPVETLSLLVNPGRRLKEEVSALTGITDAMLGKAPAVGQVIARVANFCGALPLVGHNLPFDYRFLKQAAADAGLPFNHSGVDTMDLCRRFMPNGEPKGLDAACRWYDAWEGMERIGGEFTPHRALADAWAAHCLLKALWERHGLDCQEAFHGKRLQYKVKKEKPATKRQKEVLRELAKYHRIDLSVDWEGLTQSEGSRLTDQIIFKFGRVHR